jgi:hypothetical protein
MKERKKKMKENAPLAETMEEPMTTRGAEILSSCRLKLAYRS